MAGESKNARTYEAETTQDALDLQGIVRESQNGSTVGPSGVFEGLSRAVKVASLCNVAMSAVSLNPRLMNDLRFVFQDPEEFAR